MDGQSGAREAINLNVLCIINHAVCSMQMLPDAWLLHHLQPPPDAPVVAAAEADEQASFVFMLLTPDAVTLNVVDVTFDAESNGSRGYVSVGLDPVFTIYRYIRHQR